MKGRNRQNKVHINITFTQISDMLYTNESLLKPEELMLDPVHAKMTTKC